MSKRFCSIVNFLLLFFAVILIAGCGSGDGSSAKKQVIVFEERGFIHAINADGNDERRLGEGVPDDTGIFVSPNGKQVTFSTVVNSYQGGATTEVYVLGIEDKVKRTVYTKDSDARLNLLGWLSDELLLLHHHQEIFSLNISNGSVISIITDAHSTRWGGIDHAATFSRDSKQIAYSQVKDHDAWLNEDYRTIVITDFSGNELGRLNDVLIDSLHAYFPNSKNFLIRLRRDLKVYGVGSLHVVDGNSLTIGPALVFRAHGAKLSPEGNKLAYHNSNELFVLEIDKVNALPEKILDDLGRIDHYDWSSTGGSIAYSDSNGALVVVEDNGSNGKMIKELTGYFTWLP